MTDHPTPQPGEVWENDEGERRFVYEVDDAGWVRFAISTYAFTGWDHPSTWNNWAIRTNARRILEAPKK